MVTCINTELQETRQEIRNFLRNVSYLPNSPHGARNQNNIANYRKLRALRICSSTKCGNNLACTTFRFASSFNTGFLHNVNTWSWYVLQKLFSHKHLMQQFTRFLSQLYTATFCVTLSGSRGYPPPITCSLLRCSMRPDWYNIWPQTAQI
jgi:hypothetical protein